jgi:hypothetical protein
MKIRHLENKLQEGLNYENEHWTHAQVNPRTPEGMYSLSPSRLLREVR